MATAPAPRSANAARRRALGRLVAGLAAGPVAVAGADRAAAQAGGAPASAPSFPVDLVKTGLYRIGGDGGNVLMRLSAAGIILVDAKPADHYRALRRQIARINRLGDLPLRVLFLTDLQPQRAANADTLRAAGVAVIVPRRTAAALAPAGAASQSAPVVPFDGSYRLQLGGVPVQALHVGPARTADSTLVHFPDLQVLALGDLLPVAAPWPDFDAGGSLTGWLAALDRALAFDAALAVPADGPPVPRADLLAWRQRLDAWLRRARALLGDGADHARFIAAMGEADPVWKFDLTPAQWLALRADLATAR